MKQIAFILFVWLNLIAFAQSPLCTSYPTSFCCEYVASVTINGQTYAGSNGYAATSGGTGPNGYYDYLTGEYLNITNNSIHMNKLSILWVKVK